MATVTAEVEVDLDVEMISEAIAQLEDDEAAELYEQLQNDMPERTYKEDMLDRMKALADMEPGAFIEMLQDVVRERRSKEFDLALWEFLMPRIDPTRERCDHMRGYVDGSCDRCAGT